MDDDLPNDVSAAERGQSLVELVQPEATADDSGAV